jgi:pyruvate, orthophosphate dikinase
MMETILNLGLNDRTVEALAAESGNTRFAFDSYRRFLQMYGDVVLGVPGSRVRAPAGGQAHDGRSGHRHRAWRRTSLRNLVEEYKELVGTHRRGIPDGSRRSSCGARSRPCSGRGRSRRPWTIAG